VSRCRSAASRGKASAAAERSSASPTFVRRIGSKQRRTDVARRGRSMGPNNQGRPRRADAVSKAAVRRPDTGRVVRHGYDGRVDCAAVAPADPGIVGSVQPTALPDPATVETVVRVGRPDGCRPSARSRCWRLSYGCWSRNVMSIRRGSQRRLGRPSAVIAGATVTDSTVSVISRRHAARRFAGSGSLSMSSGPMTSLSTAAPSRARAADRPGQPRSSRSPPTDPGAWTPAACRSPRSFAHRLAASICTSRMA